MQLSRYIVTVADHPQPGKTLLFSLLSGKAVALPTELLDDLRPVPNHVPSWLSSEESNVAFLREHFLVRSEEDGRRRVAETLDETIRSRRKAALSVLTTTDCNMACPYCHEGLRKQQSYMSRATAQRVARFAAQDLVCDETHELWVYFYGGEPLLNVSAIEAFLDALEVELRLIDRRPALVQDMSTNGTLLTRDVARRLRQLGLASAQITLDGPPEVHDQRRYTSNGKGTFAAILHNIKDVMDLFDITIRVNIDRRNLDSATGLLDVLADEGLLPYLRVYADFVTNTFENPPYCQSAVITELADKRRIVDVWRAFRRHGLSLPGLRFTEGMCGNLGLNSLVVDPEGRLYACIGFVGQPGYALSDIEHFAGARAGLAEQNCKPYLGCLDCPYVPVCGGGCRVQAVLETGDIAGKSCNRAFFDYAYPEFLRLKFPAEA